VDLSPELVFDPSAQASGDFAYSQARLTTPKEVQPWLVGGAVSVSHGGLVWTIAKLPALDTRSSSATSQVRLIRLLPVYGASVRYESSSAQPEFVRLWRRELTLRLRRLATFTVAYSNESRTVRVSPPAVPGMTLTPGPLMLSPKASRQQALAVSNYESTIDARTANPSDLRALARGLSGREARQLNDIANAIESSGRP